MITFLVSVGLILVGLVVGQRVEMLPVQASVNAAVYDELFRVLFSIGTILFLGICGLLVYSLVRFRRPAGDLGDGAAIEDNLPLEIVWTAIPAVVAIKASEADLTAPNRSGMRAKNIRTINTGAA